MKRGYVPLLLTLSSIWGASYLFIKVGVRDLEPAALVELRLLCAAPILVGFLAWRNGSGSLLNDLRAGIPAGIVLGTINVAIPFALISWGEKHIDSGVAAIANASVPIFNLLLAIRFAPAERVGGLRLVGVFAGLLGVGVLAGMHPDGGRWAIAGTLAVVLASVSYAAGQIFGERQTSVLAGPVLAASSVLWGAVLTLPFALLELPDHVPGWKPLGSVLALGIVGTGVAQLLLFRLLRDHGSARTSLVTYLMPPIALVYGVALLGEALTAQEVAGMGLILLGVALGSGVLRLPRRAPVTQAP